jgi:hypothetical protein
MAIAPFDEAAAWFARATTRSADWPTDALVDTKPGHRISVVIPARDEAATIGAVVREIRSALAGRGGLVDEIVVIDSDSSDDTARIAASNGAVVHAARAIRPDLAFRGRRRSQFRATQPASLPLNARCPPWCPPTAVPEDPPAP